MNSHALNYMFVNTLRCKYPEWRLEVGHLIVVCDIFVQWKTAITESEYYQNSHAFCYGFRVTNIKNRQILVDENGLHDVVCE